MAFTRVLVAGSFLDGEGDPATDVRVIGRATSSMENGAALVVNLPIVGTTDATGALVDGAGAPFSAPATDDPGTTPTGVEYDWTVQVGDGPVVTGRAPLPRAVSPVDIWTFLDWDAS